MKYVITESRLDEFLANYLDSWIENKAVTHSSPFIIISQQAQGDDEIWSDYMEHDYIDGRLWVNRDLKRNLMDISNKNEEEMKKFLKRWFENRFNVEVEFVES